MFIIIYKTINRGREVVYHNTFSDYKYFQDKSLYISFCSKKYANTTKINMTQKRNYRELKFSKKAVESLTHPLKTAHRETVTESLFEQVWLCLGFLIEVIQWLALWVW